MNIINENIRKNRINNDINIEFPIENKYFENIINNIKNFGRFNINNDLDSLILKNKDELFKFYNLLSSKIKSLNMRLLYRASRDGLNLNSLKNKINNKSNLIFLF